MKVGLDAPRVSSPLDAVPGAGAGEIEAIEAEVAETERQLSRDLIGLQSIVGGLIARVQRAKAAGAKLSRSGVADADFRDVEGRVRNLSVPAIEVQEIHRASYQARLQAARVRESSAESLRQAIKKYAAELSRFTSQLTADEGALAQFERKLRAKEQQEEKSGSGHKSVDRLAVEQLRDKSAVAPVRLPEGRRDQSRIPMQVAIDFSTESNFYVGFSADISEGGIFIATVQPIRIGSRVELSFRLPGEQPLTVLGEVRWVRQINEATPEIFPGIGVRFIDPQPSALAVIQKFIASREPMFYPE